TWVPDSEMAHNPFSLRPPLYGLHKFEQLFTRRQLLALTTFSDLVGDARQKVLTQAKKAGLPSDEASENGTASANTYADAVVTYLALGVSRLSDICNSLCMWESTKTQVRHVFTRQAIPMLWDFAQANLLGCAACAFALSLSTL